MRALRRGRRRSPAAVHRPRSPVSSIGEHSARARVVDSSSPGPPPAEVPERVRAHLRLHREAVQPDPRPQVPLPLPAPHRGRSPTSSSAGARRAASSSSPARSARARRRSPATSSPGSTRAPPPPSCSTRRSPPRSCCARSSRTCTSRSRAPRSRTTWTRCTASCSRRAREDRDVVLLIDEAQDLSAEVLEQVRLISNLETDTEKLIQIVLMGQSELQEMLGRRELRQLAQRVTARYHLSPLDRAETEDYVRHRLAVAGGEGKVSFTRRRARRGAPGRPAACPASSTSSATARCWRGYVARHARDRRGRWSEQAAREAEVAGGAAARGAGSGRARPRRLAAGLAWPRSPAPAVARRRGAGPAGRSPPRSAPAAPVADRARSRRRGAGAVSCSPRARGAPARAAESEVQALWGGGARSSARRCARTWTRCGALDLPVVLEMFHPGAPRHLLRGAGPRSRATQALVAAGAARPCACRRRSSTGCGRARPSSSGATSTPWARRADAARTAAWARESLGRLGYLGPDRDLASAVAALPARRELAADGVIGARTLMTLYSRGHLPAPAAAREAPREPDPRGAEEARARETDAGARVPGGRRAGWTGGRRVGTVPILLALAGRGCRGLRDRALGGPARTGGRVPRGDDARPARPHRHGGASDHLRRAVRPARPARSGVRWLPTTRRDDAGRPAGRPRWSAHLRLRVWPRRAWPHHRAPRRPHPRQRPRRRTRWRP